MKTKQYNHDAMVEAERRVRRKMIDKAADLSRHYPSDIEERLGDSADLYEIALRAIASGKFGNSKGLAKTALRLVKRKNDTGE